MKKIITRIKGGLGNQLFCYAAARRLAIINKAELVIDDVTGFLRDRQYQRQYMLNHFNIPFRKATPKERLEPFERLKRGGMKWFSRRKMFTERRYLEQEGLDFDERLLSLKVNGTLYLDGLWQSEGYFKDVEQTIREDLRMVPPKDSLNQQIAQKIHNGQTVAIHVRWFDVPESTITHNISAEYYWRAISLIESKIESPHYFLFSDDPESSRANFSRLGGRVTYISHNKNDENAYADLWLMSQCKHFITANSTFSWWGAWLGDPISKIVVTPKVKLSGISAWGFKGLLPDDWIQI